MSAMAGPAWSLATPVLAEWWRGGLKKRARLTGLSQYKHLLLHIYLEGLRGNKRTEATSHCHVPNVSNFCLAQWFLYVCRYSLSCIFLFCSLHLSPPSGRFERHYWNVDTGDDVTKLSRTGRGVEIIGGGQGVVDGGRYLAYFSLLVSRSAGSRQWLLRAWIWMLRLVLLLSLSVWLQPPRTRWCHSQGFVNILDKETKSRGRA